MEKRKVLILTLEYPPQVGGIASYVDAYAKEIGEEAIVYAPSNPFYKFFWPKWLKMFFKVLKIVKIEQPSVLHIHHVLPVGYIGYFLKKFKDLPYIVFLHGTDLRFGLKKKNKLKKVLSGAEKIFVNSGYMEKFLLDNFPEFESKTEIKHPPIDEIFKKKVEEKELNELREKLNTENKKIILSVGRMIKGKGFMKSLSALKKTKKDFVWLVIGEGPLMDEFKHKAKEYGLQEKIRILGKVSHKDLPIYYQISDLFLFLTNPTVGFVEGWGMVLDEAAASGLPIVAGRSGGSAEAVKGYKKAVLVDSGNEDEIFKNIERFL